MDSDDITGSESGQAVGEVEEDGEMDGEEREKALKDKLMKGKAKAGEKKKKKDSDLMDSAIVDRWNEEFGDVYRFRVEGLYGGDVFYQPGFISEEEASGWYDSLLGLDTYRPMLKLYGKTFAQSRQIAAYSTTPNATLKYSGSDIEMHHPFPAPLEIIRERLERELDVKFNHCMLNLYENGDIYIGENEMMMIIPRALDEARAKHNHQEALRQPQQPRHCVHQPRSGARLYHEPQDAEQGGSEEGRWRWGARGRPGGRVEEEEEREMGVCLGILGASSVRRRADESRLGNGSLVVMQGRSQEYWKHEIPKQPKVKTGRISLTFRQLV
ncbi:hypothetical protein P7C73_g5381, partial [Tremellales sp. Uapishka_1]